MIFNVKNGWTSFSVIAFLPKYFLKAQELFHTMGPVYDLCLYVSEHTQECLAEAKKLGYAGVFLTVPVCSKKDVKKIKDLSYECSGLDIKYGAEIRADTGSEAKKLILSCKNHYDLVGVLGGPLGVNKAAVDCKDNDVLRAPYYNSKRTGFDKPLSHLAAEHNITIDIPFSHIVQAKNHHLLSQLQSIFLYCNHYHVQTTLSSGTDNVFHMHSPSDLAAFCNVQFNIMNEPKSLLTNTANVFTHICEKKDPSIIGKGIRVIQ